MVRHGFATPDAYRRGMTSIAVLGSTGSIGTQTLDIVRAAPDRYQVFALGASRSVGQLAAQANEFRPAVVAIADASLAAELQAAVPAGTTVLAGPDALADAARDADITINGVVGFAGLGVSARVGALLAEPAPAPRNATMLGLWLAIGFTGVLALFQLHHLLSLVTALCPD